MSDDLKARGREGLERLVLEHPFFTALAEHHVRLAAGCAKNVHFREGEYLLHEGDPANEFYLLREGRVALEINAPGRHGIIIQTLGPGDVVGVSWLVPPYRWTYDARALEPVRALSVDAACLRGKCEADHELGFAMMNSFVPMLVQRLQATRLQLLDVYGRHD